MSPIKLMVKSPAGRYVVATKEDVLRAYAEVAANELPKGSVFDSPHATRGYLINVYRFFEYEIFGMLVLDNRHRLIRSVELFRGTIDGASVHPREVVKTVLELNGAAVVMFHNHPSGIADPSRADETITMRLKDALALVDVRLLDHMIIGGEKCVSLAERGVL
jgi:DNA repair protein RadC